MALQKQPVAINFSRGVDTKSDPYQVPVGSFLSLENSIFTTQGRLTKRNGYSNLTTLPNSDQTTLTTLNDNLIATGIELFAYSKDTNQWLDQGKVQPIQLSTQPLIRVSTSQSSPDTAVASTGLTCLVYLDNSVAYYQISDSTTGQQIVQRTALPSTAENPRVFLLSQFFIITFMATVGGSPHLQYIAIPIVNPSMPRPAADISINVSGVSSPYDGFIANNSLYVSWFGSGNTLKIAFLSSGLVVSGATTLASIHPLRISVTADITTSRVWVSFFDNLGAINAAAFTYTLIQVVATTQLVPPVVDVAQLTSVATGGLNTVFYETRSAYAFTGGADSNYVSKVSIDESATVTPAVVMLRSVGLASKAFITSTGDIYMMVVYGDTHQSPSTDNSNQSTYFLVDSTGAIYMRLAYGNAGGYVVSPLFVLPTVSLVGDTYYFPYLVTDFLTTVNKGTNLPSGTPVNAIYTQKGVNLAIFEIANSGQYSSEIAGALHLTGGQLWEYDGVKPVEHGFHVWPENIKATTSGSGGLITAQTYNYVFTYEWTDNAGNLHRSAPSIPVTVVTTGATSTNTINVPTLRLTFKQPFFPPTNAAVTNPVRIVGYRWSTAQQIYYQFTSVTAPKLNDTTIDYVVFTDTLADSAILGNTLLYTTGGVIENIAAPASIASALFKNRLFIIDAEDQNLLWFSKQVIESTPVEMSDLLTLYVAPTSGAQGSTGPLKALSAMDDKLIMFKQDAIYYLTGLGPDNTGANNDFTDPVFITSTVGCSNPNSIVLIPGGIMFQSDKGIWLLGRDLSTNYIGAPVEIFNSQTVMSAEAIPGTNMVLFVLANNETLMYDYYYNQWGTHTNRNGISATLYQGKHTYLNSFGQIFQQTPGMFLDGSAPVLMALTTSWINVAGLQGYERFYFANLLGTYYSPFKLNVSIAYDYNSSALQSTLVLPDNFSEPWGGEALWGSGGTWGGNGNVFSARLFPEKQKCESFQLTIQEVYDQSMGQTPGQGLALSGLAMVVGMKKGFRTQSARKSFG